MVCFCHWCGLDIVVRKFWYGVSVVLVYFDTVLMWCWSCLVWFRYDFGIVLVFMSYRVGTVLVWLWFVVLFGYDFDV